MASIHLVDRINLIEGNGQEFLDLLDFARALQAVEPRYEATFHYLVHQFVFQGSRAALLSALNRRLHATVAGHGALVLIEGVAGIGKTTLATVQEVGAQALGAVFVTGHCYEQGVAPFWLWQEIVQSVGRQTAAPLDVLPIPFGKGEEARSIQHLAKALGGWLATCAAVQPLVILLDDLHWADNDSLEILSQIVSTIGQHAVLFLVTYRSEDTHLARTLNRHLPMIRRAAAVESVRLDPITSADTAQLVTGYLGTCHPLLAAYLFQRAEGHLLFTVELLRDMVDRNLLTHDENGLWRPPDQSVPVPSLLKNVILQRVARLGEVGQTILSHAAVVGETWELALVENLMAVPEDDLLDALEQAIQADLIRVADEWQEIYGFSHGLIREVLYKQQIARRRKRLHERIGTYLEAQTPLNRVQVAHHFYEAQVWRKAFEYNRGAAREAAQNYAHHRAIELYEKALEAGQHVREEGDAHQYIEIYEGLGNAYRVLDLNQHAETAFIQMRDAARALGDRQVEGVALAHLVHIRLAQYQLDAAEQSRARGTRGCRTKRPTKTTCACLREPDKAVHCTRTNRCRGALY